MTRKLETPGFTYYEQCSSERPKNSCADIWTICSHGSMNGSAKCFMILYTQMEFLKINYHTLSLFANVL